MVALYQSDVTDRPPDQLLDSDATAFTRELVDGTVRDRAQLDELIERHARGWSLDRIAPLERNIIRVALHELLHRPDVPTEVAIDEAADLVERCAELAQRIGSEIDARSRSAGEAEGQERLL